MEWLEEMLDSDRAVSPVIATILMVAVALILAAVIGSQIFGLADGVSDPSPQANFEIEEGENEILITHTSGDSIDGDNIKLAGSAVDETISDWEGQTVSAGDTASVDTNEGELEIVIDRGERSFSLASEEVPNTVISLTGVHDADSLNNNCQINVDINSLDNADDIYVYSPFASQSSADEDGGVAGQGDSVTLDGGCGFSYANGETEQLEIWQSDEMDNRILEITVRANRGSDTFEA